MAIDDGRIEIELALGDGNSRRFTDSTAATWRACGTIVMEFVITDRQMWAIVNDMIVWHVHLWIDIGYPINNGTAVCRNRFDTQKNGH